MSRSPLIKCGSQYLYIKHPAGCSGMENSVERRIRPGGYTASVRLAATVSLLVGVDIVVGFVGQHIVEIIGDIIEFLIVINGD